MVIVENRKQGKQKTGRTERDDQRTTMMATVIIYNGCILVTATLIELNDDENHCWRCAQDIKVERVF